MLTELHIRNFKSLRDVTIEPGRVTVLIGENGCGKSNFLEAIAMAGAALGQVEGQIQPLGIKGEGLIKLLKSLSGDAERLSEIKENLRLIDWFADFKLPTSLAPYERHLEIGDRYIETSTDAEGGYFDQRSANEGFLFLLFYFTLFVSPDTPKLFAIDNIDASLNPKLCTEFMHRLTTLAQKYDKQVIITTHNPAVLDGLNLHDDQQRLFAVHRNSTRTRTRSPSSPSSNLGSTNPPARPPALLAVGRSFCNISRLGSTSRPCRPTPISRSTSTPMSRRITASPRVRVTRS